MKLYVENKRQSGIINVDLKDINPSEIIEVIQDHIFDWLDEDLHPKYEIIRSTAYMMKDDDYDETGFSVTANYMFE